MRYDIEVMNPKARRVYLSGLQQMSLEDVARQQRGRYDSARAMGIVGSKMRHPDWTEEECAAEINAMMEPFHLCKAVRGQIRFIRELAQYVAEHPE